MPAISAEDIDRCFKNYFCLSIEAILVTLYEVLQFLVASLAVDTLLSDVQH